MNRLQAARILVELDRRESRKQVLFESAFPVQRAFLEDSARLKAALCTRRAGKSFGIGISLFAGALDTPGSSQLYVSLTRESAKRIMYKDVLKAINREHKLGARFNDTTLDVVLPNGSTIYLLGVDAKPDEKNKVLGQKFRRAVVDECASFRQDLHALTYGAIKPALTDYGGDLAMVGTPGNLKNFFYHVTSGKVAGWSVHSWSAHDNPHVSRQWQEEIDELVAANPRVAETPLFRQHYMGEWTVDTTKLVYRHDAEVNDILEPPDAHGEVRYVMGIDLGYTDDTAIVIGAYSEHDERLYLVYAEKRPKIIISQVAEWIKHLRKKFPIDTFIVDNAAKQSVEELRQRYQLPLEPAEKSGKADAIAMMNSDLITGRIKVMQPHCAKLTEEWANLVWDERAEPRLLEHPSCPNHCSDAALYAWRSAMNYTATPAPARPPPLHSEEAMREQEDREDREALREERLDYWERD